MASVIDALMITLGVDSSGVQSGMAQAENTIAASAKNIMNNILAPLAAALALGSAFNEYLTGAQAAGNLATTLNENQEDIQAWGGAVERAGGDAASFEGSLLSLNSKMLEFAQTGTSSAAPALAQLGISARDSNGNIKSSIDIMQELARVADSMDPARFQALASSLGIDSGTLLLLKQGSLSVDELVARQKMLGVYTAEDSAIATKMGNAIKDLMQVLKSISTIIMRFVLPPLSWLTEKIVDFVLYIREHEVFLRAVISGIAAVLTAVLLPALIKIGAAALANPLTWIFLIVAAAVIGVSLLIEDLYVYMQGGKSALSGFWSIFGTGEQITQKLNKAWEKLKDIFSKFLDYAISQLKILAKVFGSIIKVVLLIASYLGNVFNLISSVFSLDGEGFKKALAGMWEGVKALGGEFLKIGGYIKDMVINFLGFVGLKEPLMEFFNWFSNTASAVFGKVTEWISSIKDGFLFVKDSVLGFFSPDDKNPVKPIIPTPPSASRNITTTSSVSVGNITVVSNNADPQQVAKEIPAAMNNFNSYIPANAAVGY